MSHMFSSERLMRCAKCAAPWVVGIILFWLVGYHFFAPQFEGKSLSQGDIAQYAGMSQDIREHRASTGEDPAWTGNMFSGMPAYLIDVEYPTQYVKHSVSAVARGIGDPLNMTFMAMALMMVAVVLMGVNPWIGIVAGLAYGLSTYFFLIIDAGHITKMWALVYAPPLVASVWYALRRSMWAGAVLAALFGSLELGANHPQITYYFLLACVALWISELIYAKRNKRLKSFGQRTVLLAVAALLAVGSNFAPLWYTVEHREHTTRGVSETVDEEVARSQKIEYNTAWSYGITESFNMLVPNYMGAWSGDYDGAVVELLQRPSTQQAMFDDAVDELTEVLRMDMPELRRSDVLYFLEAGDEELMEYAELLYSSRANEAWSYASNYWGAQPYTAGPTYLGAVVIFLAIMGLMLLPRRATIWVVVVSLVALLMAWGANVMGLYELFYDMLPAYKNFRTVSMSLVVLEWGAPLLAAMALWCMVRRRYTVRRLIAYALVSLSAVVVMVVTMAIVADYGVAGINERLGDALWVEQLRSAAYDARHAAFVADAWRTILFVVVAAAAVVTYALMRERRGNSTLLKASVVVVLGALICCDLCGVAGRYMAEDKWHDGSPTELVPTTADRVIMEDDDVAFRVLDLTADPFNSARASYFHRSVGGYHGAKLGRYQEVIDAHLRTFDAEVLAALNTRYIIDTESSVKRAEELTGVAPYGAAWFVSEVMPCATPVEELAAIGNVDLASVAVVGSATKGLATCYDASGEIEVVEYAPNRVVYEYRADGESLAVFSEIYFPDGWSVWIDGEEADYFAVDYVLRGMVLPAGEHSVEWRFEPPHRGAVNGVMAVASLAIFIGCVVVALFGRGIKSRYHGKCER